MSVQASAGPTTAVATFLGGAGTVTGSKTLVEQHGHRVLVDCGLFQGLRELRRRNWEPLPVDPATIDAIVLSHAHLDHSGYLPALVRQGFCGPVLCTPGTAELTEIVLRDSARLMVEEARYAREGGWSKHESPQPLYDEPDAEKAIALLQAVPEADAGGALVDAAPGIGVRLPSAGHILGSASPVLELDGLVLAFSGDLGRPVHPLLHPPGPPPAADALIVESTYGDRRHPATDPGPLADAVRRTIARGGSVLIPAFAVDRTEAVLIALSGLMQVQEIPQVPVFVDSPMALAALRVYREALSSGDQQLRPEMVARYRAGQDPFDPGDLRVARTPEESMRLNEPAMPCIIVSSSGMATGGRVVHHLAHLLPDRRTHGAAGRLPGGRDPRAGSGRRCPGAEDPRRLRAGARRDRHTRRVLGARGRRRPARLAALGSGGARGLLRQPRRGGCLGGARRADPRRAGLVRGRAAAGGAGGAALTQPRTGASAPDVPPS
jgi:metallo-beta-lactamase family protein